MPRISKRFLTGLFLTVIGVAGLAERLWRSDSGGEGPAQSERRADTGQADGARRDRPTATVVAISDASSSNSIGWQEASSGAYPLTYAQAWRADMPPAMTAFRDWTALYVAAETGFDQALLEIEGVALARARRTEMAALIESDPELALALTVPAALREILPDSVEDLLETRVSGRGDYQILMAVQPFGSRRAEETFRRVTVGETTYDAFVYGRRSDQQTQEGASLHGIALDGRMAVHESPVRVLEPGEVVPAGVPAGACPVSGAALPGIPAWFEVNLDNATVVEVDGHLWQLASSEHIDDLENRLILAEDQAGPSVPNVMAGESVEPLAPTSWTTGAKTLLIIRVDFSDKPGDPVAYQTALDLMNNSVSPYYDAASYGTASIHATVTATTYRMPQTAEAYATGDLTQQLYNDATAAAGAEYTVANYEHVMILFTRLNSGISGSKFTWAGLGSVGGGRTWINGYYDFRVTAHELGHNFGLYHANLWQVADGNAASASGSATEYADPFDVMGGGSTNSNHHFNPWFKNRLGWLPDSSVVPVTATGTYRITRFDHKNTPLGQNLALNVFCDGMRTYWVGFRQTFPGTATLNNGAYVVWGFANNQGSQLLDMTTPGSSASDAGLLAGVTFTDAVRGVSIRPLSKGGAAPSEYLDVDVTLGQPAHPFVVGWGGTSAASVPAHAVDVRTLAAGASHALALKTDGSVVGWGSNTTGQISVPSAVSGAVAVSARGNVSGAVKSDGTVVVWGDGTYGQTSVPAGLSGVTGVSIGTDHVLAVKSDGTVVAWGNNSHGESTVPAGLTGVAAVAAGNNTSYALRTNGTVTRWGATQGTIPSGLSGVVAIATSSQHALALKGDGTVVAWGANNYGQSTVPSGLSGAVSIAAGAYHSLALKSDGTLVQWGSSSLVNSRPPAMSRVSAIAVNDSANLAVIGVSSVLASPTFSAHPQHRSVAAGQSAQFSVTASGTSTLTYQWQRMAAEGATWADTANGGAYAGATTATLTVSGATGAMSGDQFRCVVSYSGSSATPSNGATLTVVAPPVINAQPASTVGIAGGSVALSVSATASGTINYQWRRDGIDIAGATSSSYTILAVQSFHAGTYSVVVTADGVSTTSSGATVTVNAAPASIARVMNLSTRGLTLTGSDVLIPGFVVEGTGTKRLLIRAVGPTLTDLGLSGALTDPQCTLKRFDSSINDYVTLVANDDWSVQQSGTTSAQIAATATAVGAFALSTGSGDAALLVDLAPGRYTVVAGGKGSDTGIAMVELYDADTVTPTARLVNISNRGFVGTGDNIMIPGFVVSAEGSRTFLIRAVGPTLANHGVTGVLADPQLTVFKRRSGTAFDDVILTNDNWAGVAGSATTASVAAQVGAFPLVNGSRDAAFVVTLPPGIYTVQASGVGATTGVALVEIYLVP